MLGMVRIRKAGPDDFGLMLSIDDDASRRYALHGYALGLKDGDLFVLAEQARWRASLEAGDVFIAETDAGGGIGIAVLGLKDGQPYLDQLSVRLDAMGRGVGDALLREAIGWARARGAPLTLNTYGHLPWNRPFYERRGFVVVPEAAWGPEMRAIIAEQRACLPDPEQRVVMRHTG